MPLLLQELLQVSGAGTFGVLSPGAGRVLDVSWPAQLGAAPANGTDTGVNVPFFTRAGAAAPSVSNTTSRTQTGVGSISRWATGTGFRGRHAISFIPGTGGASTGVLMTLDAMVLLPAFGDKANQADDSSSDEFGCWRSVAFIDFEGQADYTGETGIFWSCGNVGAYGVRDQGSSGWGFSQTAADTISFVRRSVIAGGALTVDVVRQTSVADLATWHCYEVRVIGARKSQNAQLRAFIDGQLVKQLDWVADALPNPIHSNGVYGYVTNLQARGAGAVGGNGMAVNRVRFMAGPTEASLL